MVLTARMNKLLQIFTCSNLFLLLLWHEENLANAADIILTSSLDGAQAACPGEVVTYTCTAFRTTAIEWIVTPDSLSAVFFQDSTITETKREGFQLALTSRIPNGTGTSDLTSILTVNTTASQNGTLIQCVSDNGRAKLELRVVTSLPPPPLSPEYHVQLFGQHNITVVVQWRHPEYDGLVPDNYTISGTHFVTTISENNGTTLTLPYNEYQNIRITSNNCIGSSRTTIVTFFEAGCGDPNPPIRGFIEGFDSAVEGATIHYSCRPGLVPRAQMRAACANMSWSPDPATLECKEPSPVDCGAPPPPIDGLLQPHINTTEGSVVVFQCKQEFVPKEEMMTVCGHDGQWNPIPGNVTCSPSPSPMPTFKLTPTSPTLDTAAAIHISGWVIGVMIGAVVIVVIAVSTVAAVVITAFLITRKKATGQKETELQKNVCYGEATATPVFLDPVYDEVACIDMQI